MRVAAAACSLFLGLGCGIPGVIGAIHLGRTGQVWHIAGYPTYGNGPFEKWGLPNSVGLILAFVAVCAAEVTVGLMLLLDAPGATGFAIALLPFEFIFWIGFALPIPPLIGIARTVLLFL